MIRLLKNNKQRKTKWIEPVVTANADIDNAAANNDVDNAKTTNEATIAAITPDANVKPAAKQAIADKVKLKKQQLMEITAQQLKKKQLLNNKFKLKIYLRRNRCSTYKCGS